MMCVQYALQVTMLAMSFYIKKENMSMGWSGIERNKLDFILTDLLPVELSELFSFTSFYSFLLGKDQQKVLSTMVNALKAKKASGKGVMFKDGWSTKPLKYNIMKGNKTVREMSLIQPFSAINLYLFIECYQKEILDYLEKNHCFSLRYHKKNTDLYYKSKSKAATEYFQPQSRRIGKKAIQQSGNYFKITPFESINAFADSLTWRTSNFRFKYYAKMDYKACFDSIYTHSFSWIIERSVIDAKHAENTNLFLTIDRILQNINGRSSNGIVVGPEFSRMIAELLLERIDNEVLTKLFGLGLRLHKDYEVFRYVDDIMVFSNEQKTIDLIVDSYSHISEKYRLRLNELKLVTDETPSLPKEWLEKTRILSDMLGNLFFKGRKADYDKLDENERFLVTTNYVQVDRIKDEIAVLMKQYPEDRRTIVSFLLSTLLNNISKKKNGYQLFGKQSTGKAFLLLDLSLYIYAFFPSFDQTRKIISLITYIGDEIDYKNDGELRQRLFQTIRRYSFVFNSESLFDLCDWFPFFSEYNFHLDSQIEQEIIMKIMKINNPILWANFLIYARYSKDFLVEIRKIFEPILEDEINNIVGNEEMEHAEFWYVLVFHNCPLIDPPLRRKLDSVIDTIRSKALSDPNYRQYPSLLTTVLVCDYLQQQSPNGKKPEESLFNWHGIKEIGEQITFRTYQRTVFKKYKKNRYGLYSSIP